MSKKIILTIGILIFTILGIFVCFLNKNKDAFNHSVSPIVTIQPESSLMPTTAIIDESSITETQETTIKQIIIETGIDIDSPKQYLPYELKTSKGHYLIWIYETNRLIYDGDEIYSGKNIESIALSRNGLHYAYVIKNIYLDSLYIDDGIITSASDLQFPAITDDGKQYFYVNNGDTLFKNEKEIFVHDAGILGLWISSDGSSYLAELRNIENGNFVDSLVFNGKEIYKGRELKEKILSNNGLHYSYLNSPSEVGSDDGKFVVDGDLKLKGANLNYSQITDSGHYAIADTNNRKIYIDSKSYSIDNPVARVFINDNASHYLVENGLGSWSLDGDVISLVNTKGGVEIDNNTIYAYGLVK